MDITVVAISFTKTILPSLPEMHQVPCQEVTISFATAMVQNTRSRHLTVIVRAWGELKINIDLDYDLTLHIYPAAPSHKHFSLLKFQPSAARSHRNITAVAEPLKCLCLNPQSPGACCSSPWSLLI